MRGPPRERKNARREAAGPHGFADGTVILVLALVLLQSACASVLLLHTLLQLSLARSSLRRRARSQTTGQVMPDPDPSSWPAVTVQLPVYNEKYVVERLIDNTARLCYPPDKLEIQVLDDSTDETVSLAAAKVRACRARGLRVHHVRRTHRHGFKAGALQHGLRSASGELVAVFDADFLPEPDFLQRTVPLFADPRVGMVQASWGHLNRDESSLTRAQALMLDEYFTVEQRGRSEQDCFINFNGTAGVWRVATISEAGGWSDDTLTEDLDLSYRAQLVGWRFVFLGDVVVPAELPGDIRSFRTQQFRWMKGVAQNAVRLLPQIFRADLYAHQKVHACAHLLESTMYVPIFALSILTPALAFLKAWELVGVWPFFHPGLLVGVPALAFVYYVPQRARRKDGLGLLSFVRTWLNFLVITLGLALHNSVAVVSGYLGRRSAFVRTPKYKGSGIASSHNSYSHRGLEGIAVLEFGVWLYLLGALVWGVQQGMLILLWLPACAFLGVTFVLAGSIHYACARWWQRQSEVG